MPIEYQTVIGLHIAEHQERHEVPCARRQGQADFFPLKGLCKNSYSQTPSRLYRSTV